MYLKYIPKPDKPIGVVEFLEKYHEAFTNEFTEHYYLKKDYVFNDWDMLCIDQHRPTQLYDSEGNSYTSFRPLVTCGEVGVKYYMNYGHGASYNITEIDEANFQGFHRFNEGTALTLISVVPNNRINIWRVTTRKLGGEIVCPI